MVEETREADMLQRENGNKGPVVRAAVPSFSGASKEIDSAIEQSV